jgi:dihydrofolate reductase
MEQLMHTLIAVEFSSLDGIMQSPGRRDEDTSGDFTAGGWAAAHMADDTEAAEAAMAGDNETAGIVFGHRTYRDLVGHWLSTAEPNPFADILRSTPKFVASRNADAELAYPNSTLIPGDATRTIAELKASGEGELVLMGSASLLHALQAADLIDGYILTVIPVVLGRGLRLFDTGAAPSDMRLVRGVVTTHGAFVGDYRRN